MTEPEPNEPFSMYGTLEEAVFPEDSDCELVCVCPRTGFRMPLTGWFAEADDEDISKLIGKEVSIDGDVCAIRVWPNGIKPIPEMSAEG